MPTLRDVFKIYFSSIKVELQNSSFFGVFISFFFLLHYKQIILSISQNSARIRVKLWAKTGNSNILTAFSIYVSKAAQGRYLN